MPYSYAKVQFIAYEIVTAPKKNNDGSETYLGLDNPDNDVRARCALMTRAINTARAHLPEPSSPEPPGTTLKVFLAPEFFFRGAKGAYEMTEVDAAIKFLQEFAADAQWVDWVFAFGTIVGTSSPATDNASANNPNTVKEVYNFTLLQHGGDADQGESGARVVMKELMSGIDFIAGQASPNGMLLGDVEHLGAGGAPEPGREQQCVNYDGAGIFNLVGITWGVEICLDHARDVQRLQKSPQLPGSDEVQFQLVPSCGMVIQNSSVVAKPGGYVFNCDGYGRTHDKDVASSALLKAAPLMPDTPLPPTPARHDVDGADITLTDVSPSQNVHVNDLYRAGAGRIAIYGVQAIPAGSKVKGSTKQLLWRASADYQFLFTLIYDEGDNFKTLLCQPLSITRQTDFKQKKYFVPLRLETLSEEFDQMDPTPDPNVLIACKLILGTGEFPYALWCDLDVPGFRFEGVAFQFAGAKTGNPPETIWRSQSNELEDTEVIASTKE